MSQAISYSKTADGVLVAGTEQPVAGEIELRQFFGGKRRTVRQKVKLNAAIQGKHETFSATVIDISRNGVLMRIDDMDDESSRRVSSNKLIAYSTLVLYHFELGMKIAIESIISSTADIVRLACDVDDVVGRIYLAVRLHTEVTDEQCEALGLTLADDEGQDLDLDE